MHLRTHCALCWHCRKVQVTAKAAALGRPDHGRQRDGQQHSQAQQQQQLPSGQQHPGLLEGSPEHSNGSVLGDVALLQSVDGRAVVQGGQRVKHEAGGAGGTEAPAPKR